MLLLDANEPVDWTRNQEPNTSNHEERMGHFNLKCGHFDLSIPYITCVDVVCLYFSVEFYLCVHQLQ